MKVYTNSYEAMTDSLIRGAYAERLKIVKHCLKEGFKCSISCDNFNLFCAYKDPDDLPDSIGFVKIPLDYVPEDFFYFNPEAENLIFEQRNRCNNGSEISK